MDLNILISSIITGTSALVAIIGGFLVSRVISLSSERSAIERRLREINNDISIKEEMYDRSVDLLLEEDADDFILEHYEALFFSEKSVEELLDKDNYNDLTVEKVNPFIKQFYFVKDEVITLIDKYERDTLPKDFDDIIDGISELSTPNKKTWYELVYDIIYENLPREQPTNSFGIPHAIISPPINHNLIKPVSEQQRYREMVKERDLLSDDLKSLKTQKKEQKKLLDDYGTPQGMWSGLGVLIYACIVGIVYPSTLLPYPTEYYDDITTKWFVLGLFFSELVVLFVYLGFSLYRLTKESKVI